MVINMCGFVGFTGMLENKKEILNNMMNRIIHRGPDMSGDFLDDNVALGFRRLSIIDLREAGNQPMYNEDGSVVIVYNGEIYNFEELRTELSNKGHIFKTEGDTEVLVHGYEEYGTDVLSKIRGMFAFVIYDIKRDMLFGARDFFGIKPFYYGTLSDGNLIFGSEIKSFLEHPKFVKEVNKDALRPYLTFQYSSGEDTFFKGVKKLLPAHYFIYKDGKMDIKRYWDVLFSEDKRPFDERVEELDNTVNESVRVHKISDVKVGSFLSGGIDSSYITASLMPDETFSVGFDYDKFNETDYSKELSDILHIENFKKLLTPDECFAAFSDIQYHMDEPQSNPSSVPLYFLAKLAKEHVTVVLSGEGADEIYAGYEWYDIDKNSRIYRKVPQPLRRLAALIAKRLPYFKGHDFIIKNSGKPEDYFFGQALVYTEKEALSVLADTCKGGPSPYEVTSPIYARVKGKSELLKKQYLDMNLWLPGDILLKADKMSMAHSLELRVPFLDKVVMEEAQTLPADYKICPKGTKYVLRQAANRTIPDDWANRPKAGFRVPIRFWLREEKFYSIVKGYFTSDYAKEFFNTDSIVKLLDDHYCGKANNQRKIWTVYTFLVWYKRFFIDEK